MISTTVAVGCVSGGLCGGDGDGGGIEILGVCLFVGCFFVLNFGFWCCYQNDVVLGGCFRFPELDGSQVSRLAF